MNKLSLLCVKNRRNIQPALMLMTPVSIDFAQMAVQRWIRESGSNDRDDE